MYDLLLVICSSNISVLHSLRVSYVTAHDLEKVLQFQIKTVEIAGPIRALWFKSKHIPIDNVI